MDNKSYIFIDVDQAQLLANDLAMTFMEGLEKTLERAKVTWTGDKKNDLSPRMVFWDELNTTAKVFFEFLVSDLPGDLQAKAATLKNSFLLVTEKGAYDLKLSQLREQNASYKNDILKGEAEDQAMKVQQKITAEKLKHMGGMARISYVHHLAMMQSRGSKQDQARKKAPAVLVAGDAVKLFDDIKVFVVGKAEGNCKNIGRALSGENADDNFLDQNSVLDENHDESFDFILKSENDAALDDMKDAMEEFVQQEMLYKMKLDATALLLKQEADAKKEEVAFLSHKFKTKTK